jgi:hypothetical protein
MTLPWRRSRRANGRPQRAQDESDQPPLVEHARELLLRLRIARDLDDWRELGLGRVRRSSYVRPAAARVAVTAVPPCERRELVAASLALHACHETPARGDTSFGSGQSRGRIEVCPRSRVGSALVKSLRADHAPLESAYGPGWSGDRLLREQEVGAESVYPCWIVRAVSTA